MEQSEFVNSGSEWNMMVEFLKKRVGSARWRERMGGLKSGLSFVLLECDGGSCSTKNEVWAELIEFAVM